MRLGNPHHPIGEIEDALVVRLPGRSSSLPTSMEREQQSLKGITLAEREIGWYQQREREGPDRVRSRQGAVSTQNRMRRCLFVSSPFQQRNNALSRHIRRS